MTDVVVMRCMARVGYTILPGADPVGMFLESADVEAHDGQGWADFTSDPQRAKVFASVAEALGFWRQVSTVRPVRPDGQPNRPLTAYTMEILWRSQVLQP